MKKALLIVVSYILMSALGIAFCGFLFMICGSLNFFVAGQELHIFSKNLFLHGILFSTPGVCVAAQILLILRVIRSPKKQLFSMIAYILIGCATWCFLFPKVIECATNLDRQAKENVLVNLSAGYFREDKSGIYYYSRVRENGKADGLYIDIMGNSGEVGKVMEFYDKESTTTLSYPYADILTKDALSAPKIIAVPLEIYSTILKVARLSWGGGKFSWLAFSSIGLALLSLYGFQYFSMWKLVNSITVLSGGAFIVILNYILYSGRFIPQNMTNFADGLNIKIVVYVNIFIAVVSVVYGFAMCIYRMNLEKDKSDSE